ncbi:putative quinol monooxygenase [Vagococcus sp.]|uniref:putative quinol monooxygenase n=1 Tax=Vagococcus sp. TaxID=1933889 RepID=UPI003F988265
MILLIAEDFIKTDQVTNVLPFYEELVRETRKEIGCISYQLTQDLNEKGHFIFVEHWIDENAIQNHTQTEHFKRLVPLIDQHIRKKAKYTRMEIIF